MEHTKHLWRAILILVIVAAVYLLGRGFLVPDSFGKYGYFRGDNLQEQMNIRVPRHGNGMESCGFCHEEKVEAIVETPHRVINCETCHAALRTHVEYDSIDKFLEDPSNYEWTAEMEIHSAQELCIKCHDYQLAKPDDYTTIVVVEHLEERDMKLGPDVCLECHDPHDPEM
ncbi:MAG: hypothetical protein RRA15_09070 [bacterium]|nr:hypothetical protein [bacterium]MDT8366633.1 hypothetical protein [bacterium]